MQEQGQEHEYVRPSVIAMEILRNTGSKDA